MADAILSPKMRNIARQKFGRLTVRQFIGLRGRRPLWLCDCACGRTVEATTNALTRTDDPRQSCGCLSREVLAARNQRHGLSHTPEYAVWSGIKQRCLNARSKAYQNYGGRGVTICDRWVHSFENFLEDMGPKPSPQHTIERQDNNGNYEPGNCRWATATEQGRNKRNNRLLEFDGARLTVPEWAERLGVKQDTLYMRLHRGWSVADVLTAPLKERHFITWRGETKTLTEWANELGILPITLCARFRIGWTVEEAFTTPVRGGGDHA